MFTQDPRIPLRGDDQRINIRHDHEVTYWSYELNCTPDELIEIIEEVGPAVHEVRAQLFLREHHESA